MEALPTPARRATASTVNPAQPSSPNTSAAARRTRRSTPGSRGRPRPDAAAGSMREACQPRRTATTRAPGPRWTIRGMDETPRGTAPSAADRRRWRRMLADEQEEARVYRDLAGRRSGEEREVLLGLAEAEGRHAAHWARLLGEDAAGVGRGSPRMRLLA